MNIKAKIFKFGVIAALMLASMPAVAVPTISEIKISGQRRIDETAVIEKLGLSKGDEVTETKLNQALRNLFDSGIFADAKIKFQAGALIVDVVENPIIGKVAFEGNSAVASEDLQREISSRPRVVYSKAKVSADAKRIIDIYLRQGHFSITVDPKIIEREDGRVDLVFEISEGAKTYIKKINIIGNTVFSDDEIKENIHSVEDRWWRFFATMNVYDPDRIKMEGELIRRLYLNNGYADITINKINSDLDLDLSGFVISFDITEGEIYKYNEIKIQNPLVDVNFEALEKKLQEFSGRTYNQMEVERIQKLISDQAAAAGYAFTEVKPMIKKNKENKTLDIVFNIDEGSKVYIKRINIYGNVRTRDEVVRREMRISEGDAFNPQNFERSKERIATLNFFNKIEFNDEQDPNAPDQMILNLNLGEMSTGEVSFGFGYSSYNGGFLQAAITERNFLGKGQKVSLSANFSSKKNEFSFSFTEPSFLDLDLWSGFEIFHTTRSYQSYSGYDWITRGVAFRAGYSFTEYLSQSWRTTIKQDEITDISSNASSAVKAMKGTKDMITLGQSLTYNRMRALGGYTISLHNEYAGFWSDESFLKSDINYMYQKSLFSQVKFGFSLNAGYIVGFDDRISSNYLYYLGGESLRGFESYGIGSRDKRYPSGSAYGGVWVAYGSAQVNFPIFIPKEWGILGNAFVDFGTIGESEIEDPNLVYSSKIRSSIGIGISWNSPIGPLSFSWAKALSYDKYDLRSTFRFSVGRKF